MKERDTFQHIEGPTKHTFQEEAETDCFHQEAVNRGLKCHFLQTCGVNLDLKMPLVAHENLLQVLESRLIK